MIALRDRPILGTSALLIFLLSSICLYHITTSPLAVSTTTTSILLVFLLNAAIMLGWFAFDIYGGIPITLTAFIMVLAIAATAKRHDLTVWTAPFLVSALIGYSFRRSTNNRKRVHGIHLEKLEEEVNLLSDSVEKRRREISSLEEKLMRYSTLKEVAETLSAALSLDDSTAIISDKALHIIGKKGRILLFLVDAQRQELMLVASRNAETVKTKKGDIFDMWVLRNRKSLIIEDVAKDFRFPSLEAEGAPADFHSLIATPLVSENKVIGIVRMDADEPGLYTQDDLRLLDIIADLGAVAIQNAILYAKTQELAIHDGLTGLFVRRHYMQRLREEVRRAARRKDALSLLMIDIDHFKEYNDRYGHATGDIVLKHIARVLNASLREGDMLARYGGEEFVMLLAGADRAHAAVIAETVRLRIANEPLTVRLQQFHVSVSIGVADYPHDAVTEDDLIKFADERLYKAKAQGRNRVCSA